MKRAEFKRAVMKMVDGLEDGRFEEHLLFSEWVEELVQRMEEIQDEQDSIDAQRRNL